MTRKLRRLAELSPSELLLLLQLSVCSLAVGAGLRVVGLPRLTRFILQCTPHQWLRYFPVFHARYEVSRLATLADWASRITPVAGPCLTRSLLLLWLIKARGEQAELLIGVTKEATLYGHAWIEMRGVVVGDNPAITERFVPVLRF